MQSDKCNNNHNCPPLRFHADDGSEYSDWSKDTLGNLGTFDKGKTLSKSDISDSGTPMVLYGELYTHYDEIARNIVRKTKHPLDDIYITKGREVVLPCSGETAEDISTATCIISKGVALGSDLIIYNSNFVAGEIISYILNHQQKWNIAKLAQGKSVVHISADLLKKLEIVYPASSDEQQKIIALFSAYDEKIAFQKERVKILLEQKKGLLQKMFPQKGETVPELRIPGFTGDWEQRKLSEITDKVTEKNAGLQYVETFTNSAEFGIISQRDFFDHDIAKLGSLDGYYIVRNEDFVYNPRISTSAPVGPINRNKLGRTGVMSPLYTVFRPHDIDTTYLEYFFKCGYWHSFMNFNGDSGARSDRFSIRDNVFFQMPIPIPDIDEQRKIGELLTCLDNLIALHQRKLELLKEIKKGLLQQMFC